MSIHAFSLAHAALVAMLLIVGAVDRFVRQSTLYAQAPCPSGEIYTFDFFMGDAGLWPRTGDLQMHQYLSGVTLAYVKWGNPDTREWYRYDASDDHIHHHEDSTAGNPAVYWFTQDKWLRRCMSVGEVVDNPSNDIVHLNGSCQELGRSAYPYSVRLDEIWPNYDTGPDLGIRDVMVVTYDPIDPTYYERFFYAKGAGWVGWQAWRNGALESQALFNLFGGTVVNPTAPCRPF